MGKVRAQSAGFTLVEVLITLGVLSVGMVALNQYLFNTMRSSKSLDHKLGAQNLGTRLKLNLADPKGCAKVLDLASHPLDINSAFTRSSPDFGGDRFLDDTGGFSFASLALAGGAPLAVGQVDNGLKIDSFQLQLADPTAVTRDQPALATLYVRVVDPAAGSKPQAQGINSFVESVPVSLMKDATGRYTSCAGAGSLSAGCSPGQVLVGVDAGNALCQPKVACTSGQVLKFVANQAAVPPSEDGPGSDAVVNEFVCQDPPLQNGGTIMMCKGGCT